MLLWLEARTPLSTEPGKVNIFQKISGDVVGSKLEAGNYVVLTSYFASSNTPKFPLVMEIIVYNKQLCNSLIF